MAGEIMWSVGQIAARDGISKQAVSKTLQRLVEAGDVPVERDGRGRIAKVSLAHYDHARERFINPAKTPVRSEAPAAMPTAGPASESFEEARRQSEWMKVAREKIRHQEELGLLVRADGIAAALEQSGREIQMIVARLPNRSDDLALAVSKEGVHGLRVMLRQVAFELNETIARQLATVAATAPAGDPVREDATEAPPA